MSGPHLVWARPRTKSALLGGTAPVQTPAGPPPQPNLSMADAVRAAWWSGHDMAERRYYTQGWRNGALAGLLWGAALGGLVGWAVPAGVAAITRWLTTWLVL